MKSSKEVWAIEMNNPATRTSMVIGYCKSKQEADKVLKILSQEVGRPFMVDYITYKLDRLKAD